MNTNSPTIYLTKDYVKANIDNDTTQNSVRANYLFFVIEPTQFYKTSKIILLLSLF